MFCSVTCTAWKHQTVQSIEGVTEQGTKVLLSNKSQCINSILLYTYM